MFRSCAQDVVYPLCKPLAPAGNHIIVLSGNLIA
jgi:hypothetical protein